MTAEKFGTDFRSTNLDMLLAAIVTIGFPFLAMKLYDLTGALLPILIYYFVLCVGLVKWRKGALDYRWPKKLVSIIFTGLLILQVVHFLVSIKIVPPVKEFSLIGFILTLLIWCPVNAFSEQLLWIYIYDAFANRFDTKWLKIVFSGIGLIFFWGFIGLIHIFFWAKFLMEIHTTFPFFQIFLGVQYPITIGYLIIYRRTKSMYPIAIVHLIQDLGGVLLAGYSILPYLTK